jgi:hypothetical protein
MARYTEDVRTRLTADQLARLREAAGEEGALPAEIVRKAVDQYVDGELPPAALRLVERILDSLVPAIRAEVESAVARQQPVQKSVMDPAVAEAVLAVVQRLERAEAAAGI